MTLHTTQNVAIGYIVIVIILFIYRSYMYNTLITGMWEADASFCLEAGLSYFYLMIGPDDIFGSRSCYILSGQDSDIIINKPTTVTISFDWTSGLLNETHFYAYFHDVKEISDVFPASQYIKFYPDCAKIVMYYHDSDSNDSTITAVMYKNGASSEIVCTE